MSSLIRGEAVALIDRRSAGSVVSAPRIFGSRVLRGDHVGMERPMSLAAPVTRPPVADIDELLQIEESTAPPPDFAAVEEAARLQGYNVGYEEGMAAGLAAAEAQMSKQLAQLSALLGSVHENHAAFFRSAERQVVDLALQIAQKVVEREVENMPDLAVNVIRSALDEMDARTAVRVRVNPDDAEVLRRRWTQVVPPGVSADRIELQPDERVSSGGAVIETTHGQVDAQLDSKLAQLGNALWTFVMDVDSSRSADEGID
jgi:flagellar biosynthesis/type III secretory pathway protein FliH